MFEHYKIYITLALAIVMILLIAFLRPHQNNSKNEIEKSSADMPQKEVDPDNYSYLKFRNPNKYNMVALGDSRGYYAIDPAEMRKVLNGLTIFNYSFTDCQYKQEVYSRAEALLDSTSDKKMLLIAIAPREFMGRDNGELHDMLKKTDHGVLKKQYVNLDRFEPVDQSRLPDKVVIIGNQVQETVIHEYNDGWCTRKNIPEDTTQCLEIYKGLFQESNVKPEVVKDFIEQVKTWRTKGIKVYGFKPPVTRALDSLLQREAKWDMPTFIHDFENAGGVWLDVDRTLYHTFDGTHLDDTSAIKLSRKLAEQIATKQ